MSHLKTISSSLSGILGIPVLATEGEMAPASSEYIVLRTAPDRQIALFIHSQEGISKLRKLGAEVADKLDAKTAPLPISRQIGITEFSFLYSRMRSGELACEDSLELMFTYDFGTIPSERADSPH